VDLPWRDLATERPSERCPFWTKARRSVLPLLGRVSWKSAEGARFEAYAFEAHGHRYGFVRLHTYDLPRGDQLDAIREFDAVIDSFIAQHIDALVIDQRGNGGGNFLFAYAMLARLFERPIVPTKQRFLVNGDDIVGLGPRSELLRLAERLRSPQTDDEARAAMGSIPLFSMYFGFGPRDLRTAHDAASFFRFFESQPSGLTPPHFVIVPEFRSENRGPILAKPVVMIIDGMAISAADYVPATLQDNGHVTLFGTTTSGAGGDQRHVGLEDVCTPGRQLVLACAPPEVIAALKVLGFTGFSYTVTLGERPDGRLLENVGAIPDVPYRIRAEDLTGEFSSMRGQILDTLEKRLSGVSFSTVR
jgi:C-terminal processing protease CtpA/Prc